eukprot:gene20553-7518_t
MKKVFSLASIPEKVGRLNKLRADRRAAHEWYDEEGYYATEERALMGIEIDISEAPCVSMLVSHKRYFPSGGGGGVSFLFTLASGLRLPWATLQGTGVSDKTMCECP